MHTASWLTSRELSEEAGAWDTRMLSDDDGEYFCRILMKSDGVRFVSEARSYYRVPSPSTLSYIGQSDQKMEAQFLSMKLHINYVRTVEDSERVRAACVQYLQSWLGFFHPERLDIIHEAESLAATMGGQLKPPSLAQKYYWLKMLFGWSIAKRARLFCNKWKATAFRAWDKVLFQLEAPSRSIRS